jgi:hypothetical protein
MPQPTPSRNENALRQQYLDAILNSRSPRKLIVAGPGSGKTHTLGAILRAAPAGDKLALTFIRKLVADMNREFGTVAEVKTFHAYCKMLLHSRFGPVTLIPFLDQVIEQDARAMRSRLRAFRAAFQTLQVGSDEIAFYLARGNYYRAVSFDDAVFRVVEGAIAGTLDLPEYSQVVIDEYQDFNPLEAMLIHLLEQTSPILIVGDDDQAVYRARNASPRYLRERYHSGQYQLFELPFCSRCPAAVVEATSGFVASVARSGGLPGRIDRQFLPFHSGKERTNALYPRVITARTLNLTGTAGLIRRAAARIPSEDIAEAQEKNYPCVLVVGQRQHLNPIYNALARPFPAIEFAHAEDREYSLADAYELLLGDESSNLGWRLAAHCDLPSAQARAAIVATREGAPIRPLLPPAFVRRHLSVLRLLGAQPLAAAQRAALAALLGDKADAIVSRFSVPDIIPEPESPPGVPTVLLSSFEGCKGLSAGHVFIVGLNDGEFPRFRPGEPIPDIEYCKFIVAMTRARKSLFLISNLHRGRPSGRPAAPSHFIQMIPGGSRTDAGVLAANRMEDFLHQTFPAPQ